MQFAQQQTILVSLFSLLLIGCSSEQGGSANHVDVRDGVAILIFGQGGTEYKLGKVSGDQVALFATYGGVTITMTELEKTVSKIGPEDTSNQQSALQSAFFKYRLPGIWKLEIATVNGKDQPVQDNDPSYLVIRADKTFRIIKKGRKPEGTWALNSEGQLVMNLADGQSITQEIKRQQGEKLELTTKDEDGDLLTALYGRTSLIEEPKAVDEQ